MPSKYPIKLHVNGEWRQLEIEPSRTLLQVLRDDLLLTGTKVNCERGECGACTVLLDGKAINSCLVLAVSVSGHEITTIEGLSVGDHLDPIQSAFIEADASHCGFCTPGMILAVKSLLSDNPKPSGDEIKTALAGNYCRCTGYANIVKAVNLAVNALENDMEEINE
jgi:carbon-monoxide dehydrogenase small subunit